MRELCSQNMPFAALSDGSRSWWRQVGLGLLDLLPLRVQVPGEAEGVGICMPRENHTQKCTCSLVTLQCCPGDRDRQAGK